MYVLLFTVTQRTEIVLGVSKAYGSSSNNNNSSRRSSKQWIATLAWELHISFFSCCLLSLFLEVPCTKSSAPKKMLAVILRAEILLMIYVGIMRIC